MLSGGLLVLIRMLINHIAVLRKIVDNIVAVFLQSRTSRRRKPKVGGRNSAPNAFVGNTKHMGRIGRDWQIQLEQEWL